MKLFQTLAAAALAFLLASCGGSSRPSADSPEIAVIRASIAAFNAHNPDALVALYADDVKWFSVDSDKVSTEGENRDAIQRWLVGYFKSVPDVHSEVGDFVQTGIHVSFRETVTWTGERGRRLTQSSIAVYEVRSGKIKRAWYFPAARETAPAK